LFELNYFKDFDETLICEHTGGHWRGSLADLASKVRPLFRKLVYLSIDISYRCVCTNKHLFVMIHVHMYIYIHMCIHMYIHMCIHVYIHMHIRICILVYFIYRIIIIWLLYRLVPLAMKSDILIAIVIYYYTCLQTYVYIYECMHMHTHIFKCVFYNVGWYLWLWRVVYW
jgi:hypothetical protein